MSIETTQKPMIFPAMVAVMRDIKAVGKDQNNATQNYKFRGIDDVYNAVHPLLQRHGIFLTSELLESKREERQSKSGGINIWTLLKIKHTYWAEDGSSVESTTQGEAMDSADKGSNKAMSASQKYCIIQTFAIPTVEGSPDSDKGSPVDVTEDIMLEILKFPTKSDLTEWANKQTHLHKNINFTTAVKKQLTQLK